MNNYVLLTAFAVISYMTLYLLWVLYQNHLIRKQSKTGVLLQVTLEKDSDVKPEYLEQMWNNFHGLLLPWYKRLLRAQPYISFEIKSQNILNKGKKTKEITFNFWVPEDYSDLVSERISATYPNAQITRISQEDDYVPHELDTDRELETAEIGLRSDSAFSIKTFDNYDSDPLNSITSSLSGLKEHEIGIIQLVVRPVSSKWNRRASRVLSKYERTGSKPSKLPEWTNLFGKFFGLFFKVFDSILSGLFGSNPEINIPKHTKSSEESQQQKAMLEKVSRPNFAFQMRLLVGSPYGSANAKQRIRNISSGLRELDGPHNSFKRELIINKGRTYRRIKNRYLSYVNNDDVLSSFELAGFAHLPNKTSKTPGYKHIQSKRSEIPQDVSSENAFAVGIDNQNNRRMIGLDEKARMRHVYCSGMTGVGKSTLLENMILNDINSGKGAVVIDPHGELCDVILEKMDPKRQDVFVLDPSSIGHPFGMNLLEVNSDDPEQREMEKVLVIDAYITAMKRVFGESSIGANTDDIFRMSCSAILDHPDGGGLLEMLLMIVSDPFRQRIIPFIQDPIVKNYWDTVFPALNGDAKFASQNLNAPLNKIRRFIANGVVANIICQKKSTINVAEAINNGAVILARFSRGDVGFENSALLGTMLISKIQIAAMQRVNVPPEQRVATYLYVDEFQNFVGRLIAPLCGDAYRTTPLIQGNSQTDETILSQAC